MQKDQDADRSSIYSGRSDGKQASTSAIKLRANLLVNKPPRQWVLDRTVKEWNEDIFPDAALFRGYDELLWGYFIIAVYKDPASGKLSSLIVDKLGTTHFNPVDISSQSRFHPAIENLSAPNAQSSVRKCIAVSLLQKCAELSPEMMTKLQTSMKYDYDPTAAGDLANACELIGFCSPRDLGKSLTCLGFLQDRSVGSLLLDVVYEHSQDTIDSNNELVLQLGDQLEQLFDPLAEYSPEQTEFIYTPPEDDNSLAKDDPLTSSICNELLSVQNNFTLTLVEFLQNFLIPLRIEVSNDEVMGLSTSKLNRLFPPTIDEVTRINCIFLDALKMSKAYGSEEVLKACSVTIPYFYKAYTRHEAATKNFSKDIKLFMAKFRGVLPRREVYSEMKIDMILKSPQEILLKLKLVLERLKSNMSYEKEKEHLVTARFSRIFEIISSFGADERLIKSYSTRVFTPSGKLLTELAKGWPLELQYRWLKRRVVGVFDVVDPNDNCQRSLLVIFSDYIVLLTVIENDDYFDSLVGQRPLLSSILMNSLINEVPLPPKVPKLQVADYFHINSVMASTFEKDIIRIDCVDPSRPRAVALQICSSSTHSSEVVDLIVKAKILEKDTAFHLFRFMDGGLQIFSTAHELSAYSTENIRSKFCLFLNVSPTVSFLADFNLAVAFFAAVNSKGDVHITQLTCEGITSEFTIDICHLASFIVQQFQSLYPKYYSGPQSPYFPQLLTINGMLAKRAGRQFSGGSAFDSSSRATGTSPSVSSRLNFSRSRSQNTIRTFRSSTNGVEQANNAMLESSAIQPSKITEVVGPKALSKAPKSKKKRRSFFGKFSNLFRKHKVDNHTVTVPKSPPSYQSSKLVHNKAEPLPRRSSKRVDSTLHIPLNASLQNNKRRSSITSQDMQEAKSLSAAKKHESRALPSYADHTAVEDNAARSHLQTIAKNGPILDENNSSSKQSPEERQSLLYHDDLYGDMFDSERQDLDQGNLSQGFGQDNGRSIEVPVPTKFDVVCNDSSTTKYTDVADSNTESLRQPNCEASECSKKRETNDLDDSEKLHSYSSPNISHKLGIFPRVERMAIQKTTFEKSPSFRELFGQMRLVLDENDERVNWKRLPSQTSLKTKNESSGIHAFKRLVPLNRPTVDTGASSRKYHEEPKQFVSLQENSLGNGELKSESSQLPVDAEDGAQHDEVSIKTSITSLDLKKGPSARFKVVHHSPSKMISLITNSSSSSSNLMCKDASASESAGKTHSDSTSEMSGADGGMAFEPINNFHGDINGEQEYFTPVEFQHEVFKEGDENIGPMAGDTSRSSNIRQESPNNGIQRTAVQQELLDDPQFSSFHMTFSDIDDSQNSPYTKVLPAVSTYSNAPCHPSLQPLMPPEPVFYRLPAIGASTDTYFTCADDQAGRSENRRHSVQRYGLEEEEEAIWVSPSKLDIFDLSKLPEAVFSKIKPAKDNISGPSRIQVSPSYVDDTDVLPDFSYAYLGDLLSHDEQEDKNLDDSEQSERTRLQFY
ncbi:LADA_0H15918g1_1 [Lachancea dasiensis]|uniref:LADA_0H15918g1_1 n=1 Tax=Lachancea dasiensis TaxID=1072105 RepID=A0A1G4K597_9SACH|nr:LADA_0H15918g1_1 [Lachancea dasiensis]